MSDDERRRLFVAMFFDRDVFPKWVETPGFSDPEPCTCDTHPAGYDPECPVHREPNQLKLELNPTWTGNFPPGY